MDISNYLALLFGFTLVVMAFAILLRPRTVNICFEIARDDKMRTLLGILNLFLGIAFVLLHNVWDLSWYTLVTIISWLIIARGVLMLFFHEKLLKIVSYLENNINWMPFISLACILIGCFLIFMGIAY